VTFYETVTAAIRDFATHGFDSADRLTKWQELLRKSAEQAGASSSRMEAMLNDALKAIYRRLVERGGILQRHPGVQRWTLAKFAPRLRAELDRRIMASSQLIRLNRQQAIEQTIRRFSGWASSVPAGGSKTTDKGEVKEDVRKALASLPFVERRVLIDQGHKFTASLNNILAVDGGAIAARWFSHWRQVNYDYRPDHKERDGQVYLVRNNWAQTRGLIKVGPAGYTDQITQPGEEVFCRCSYTYIYNLRDMPDEMLTAKGREELERVRVA